MSSLEKLKDLARVGSYFGNSEKKSWLVDAPFRWDILHLKLFSEFALISKLIAYMNCL